MFLTFQSNASLALFTNFENGIVFGGQGTPIENECQPNYIILMTDGFSCIDSGVQTGYFITPTLAANGSVTDVPDRYDMYQKTSIFGANYMQDKNNKWLSIGDYITRKTNEGLDLGGKLAPFVHSTFWTAATNDEIPTGTVWVYPHWYQGLAWNKIESGSPTLGDSDLQTNRELTPDEAKRLIKANDPYITGYNKNDPSRPFPQLTFLTLSDNSTTLLLSSQGYLQNTQIFQGTMANANFYGSDYLDDVAAFLSNEDLRPKLGSGKYENQTVKTYTVGFMFSTDILERTAIMGGTGGKDKGYFTAEDYDELKSAFGNILSEIKQNVSVFASPVVPVSNDNSGYSGNHFYMSLFKPRQDYWLGNLKRYTLDSNHTMSPYKENGVIRSDAQSDWSSVQDGSDITKGGVVESLNPVLESMVGVTNSAGLRRIYTYIESNNQALLAHTSNLFIESNTKLTENNGALLGLNSSQSTVQTAITSIRLTPMGAVIHSEPAVVHYPSQTVVFVGANDGFLHAFLDNNSSAPEAWAFVMPEHLATITKARTSTPNDGVYYVDGYITINDVDNQKVLVTGARRGGSTYAALDITSYSDPKFLFQIPSLKASEASLWSNIFMGQSWGRPKFIETHKSASGSGDAAIFTPYDNVKNGTFILVPGGYDTRYDTLTAAQISSPLGSVIVGVNAITGKPDDKFELLNSKRSNIMKHAVLDLLPLDMNNDGLMDTLYYGDLGGNLFYAWPYAQSVSGLGYTYTPQEDFVPYLLFKTKNGENSGRMFMFAPAVLKKGGVEYVFFGSGNREKPLKTNVQDRFYCVQNKDKNRLAATGGVTNYLTEDDLANVTNNLIQSELDAASGWYFDLLEGEKIVGSPVAYRTYVAFTTYLPLEDEAFNALDICKTGSIGEARLYIVNYRTGGGVMDRNNDDKIDNDDRSVVIGTSIPTAPTLAIYEDGSAVVFTVVGISSPGDPGDEEKDDLSPTDDQLPNEPSSGPKVFYWREVY